MKSSIFKSGYISLIGRTNVGKSTLINRIFEKNVVIVSDKAQTTRSRINCIYNTEDSQAIFVDCPGFFKPRNLLGEKLNKIIYEVMDDSDLIAAVVDAAGGIGTGDLYVFDKIRKKSQPKFLIINKIDAVDKNDLENILFRADSLKKDYDFFSEIIPLSALTGENVDIFLKAVIENLPAGPRYYPDTQITDMPISKMIAEIIREKLVSNLFEELPHSINVEVDSFEKKTTSKGENLSKISCSIFVEKKSHKAIIIGKSGKMLKKVGELSRKEIETLLGTKVFLQLWVRILENWTKNEQYLDRFGFE